MEGEPASLKDSALLQWSPHLVLDGAEVAASMIGAAEIVVCLPERRSAAVAAVTRAVTERSRSRRGLPVSLRHPPDGYVTGEESALVGWVERGQALPVLRLDKSVPLTVGRRAALVHNAETLAQVGLVARHGADWFRQRGTAEAPGTTLVTVSGVGPDPVLLEVELGRPVADILERAGCAHPLSAALVGGYGGAWLAAADLSTPYAPGPLARVGAVAGVGVVVALPTTSCGMAETARLVRYLAGESAGQCGPCVFGLPAVADDLDRLAGGTGGPGTVDRLEGRLAQIDGRGACRHPDGAVRLVRSALTVFADDVRAHAGGRPCPGVGSPTVLTPPAGRGWPS
jgi:NADH:ubiquinone oxidoreductase subunit F (NADH-binding)